MDMNMENGERAEFHVITAYGEFRAYGIAKLMNQTTGILQLLVSFEHAQEEFQSEWVRHPLGGNLGHIRRMLIPGNDYTGLLKGDLTEVVWDGPGGKIQIIRRG